MMCLNNLRTFAITMKTVALTGAWSSCKTCVVISGRWEQQCYVKLQISETYITQYNSANKNTLSNLIDQMVKKNSFLLAEIHRKNWYE